MIVDQGAGVFFPRMEGIAWGVQYKNALDDKRFNLQFGQNTLCTDLFLGVEASAQCICIFAKMMQIKRVNFD